MELSGTGNAHNLAAIFTLSSLYVNLVLYGSLIPFSIAAEVALNDE